MPWQLKYVGAVEAGNKLSLMRNQGSGYNLYIKA